LHRFWFGTLGEGVGDEVILAVTGPQSVEIHCHGGRRVVQWIIDQFLASGGRQPPDVAGKIRGLTPPARLLQHAPTLRTAAILLDQLHGAFDNAVRHVLELLEANDASNYPLLLTEFSDLVRFGPIGRHLIEPWKVVVAGPPNVGKSSLVNALAGYQRAVVSEIAGTTRDVVSVQLAFDGWPVELTDTAGLRDAEGLEAAGIDRAKRSLAHADLVLWVMDVTDPNPILPDLSDGSFPGRGELILLANKSDRAAAWAPRDYRFEVNVQRKPYPGSNIELAASECTVTPFPVSAATGAGLRELLNWITRIFVPEPPPPGAPVPYTPELASNVTDAYLGFVQGNGNACVRAEAIRLLRDCLPRD